MPEFQKRHFEGTPTGFLVFCFFFEGKKIPKNTAHFLQKKERKQVPKCSLLCKVKLLVKTFKTKQSKLYNLKLD